ncbi:acyltransferase [uncultured Aquimarina sp.]|uniref:acyltransferase n=1 Tax=uncultured Aquimarina sp. TaxID=575652 RepID=UPI0026225407|nr:acyltransferase [uncultured Aquimarina sp.]
MIKRFLNSFYYRVLSPNKYAKRVGVKYGENCVFRTKYFGSEPYLIEVGDRVATSSNVHFVTHDGSLSVIRGLFKEYRNIDLFDKIIIGNNVFIGINSTILPGTKIGDNVIVGAGSIVKGELKANSIYAGCPAKFILSIEDYLKKNEAKFDFTHDMSPMDKKLFLSKKFNIQ